MQDSRQTLAADARLRAFDGNAGRVVVAIGVSLTLFFAMLIVATGFIMTSDDGMRTLDSDFRVFWAAARLALAGEPLAPFEMARLEAEYNVVTDAWMPWLYPPGYLLLVAPLGLLSYAMAALVMTLMSVSAMAFAARPFVAGVSAFGAAMALAPAYLPAIIIGQNSLVWLAVLLAALAALQSGRGLLAGVLIGCLTLKPQLGVMIPFALLAAGQWRTILAATGTAVALAALPTLVVGAAYWPLLATRLAEHAAQMTRLADQLFLTVGPLYLAAQSGLSNPAALTLQWGILAAVALSVLVYWRSERVGFDAKVAFLLLAILLSAPYLWYYEAALMPAIGLFLVRAGILTTRPLHVALLVLLWIGAGVQSLDLVFPAFDDRYFGAVIVTPVLCVAFALCWLHFFRAGRSVAEAT